MKLDIAGGLECRRGYINVDRYAVDEGVRADGLRLPFADSSVDAVNASHYLEHLPKRMVVYQLTEIYRVMRFGAALDIEVPELAWVLRNWLKYQDNGWNMDAIFGDQSTDGQYHKTGFTRQIMYSYLEAAGFRGTVTVTEKWSHEQNCLCFSIVK